MKELSKDTINEAISFPTMFNSILDFCIEKYNLNREQGITFKCIFFNEFYICREENNLLEFDSNTIKFKYIKILYLK